MTDDKQWNGAIGGGAPPVGNVRIPAKPEPVTEAKPSGKDRVGRIFDQTGDARDISKHERLLAETFAEIAQGNSDLGVVEAAVQQVEFRREIVGEWCVETALSAEIERIIQAMWRAFSGGLPVETMTRENRDRFTRMAKAARREMRRSAMERPGGVGFTHPLEFRDEPQPQQSNEEKTAAPEPTGATTDAVRRGEPRAVYVLDPCAACGCYPPAHRNFGGQLSHDFERGKSQLRAARPKYTDALRSDREQTWPGRADKRPVRADVVNFDQQCWACGEPPGAHRDGGGTLDHKFVQRRCRTCNQLAPYHHVLCGGSRVGENQP